MDKDVLKRELRTRYAKTCRKCKDFGYTPTRFLNMISGNDDIVEITRRLIYKDGGISGLEILRQNDQMDLSVEKIILEEEFRDLFTREDLAVAYKRLEECEYPGLDQIKKPE